MRKIIQLYINQILDKNNPITIDDVPNKLRKEVQEELEKINSK